MKLMNKGDLKHDDYSWTVYGDDDPEITGRLDSTFLNRKEGYEVLYFINKYADDNGITDLDVALKIETLIHEKLPSYIRSQENVKKWIDGKL